MVTKEKTRVGSLATPIKCRMELGRLYRAARRGQIDTADAGRLANILKIMVGIMRDTDLEQRIAKLEEANGNT